MKEFPSPFERFRSAYRRWRAPYLDLLDQAADAERRGDEVARGVLVKRAFAARDAQLERKPLSPRTWRYLAQFAARTFDLEGLESALGKVVGRRKHALKCQFGRLRSSSSLFARAHASLRRAADGLEEPYAPITLYVPLNAIRKGPTGAQLRFTLRAIDAALEASGAPYAIDVRFSAQGRKQAEPGRRYISYHTFSAEDGGLHFKEADQLGFISFDERGFSGWSQFGETPLNELGLERSPQHIVTNYVSEFRKRVVSGNVSKMEQSETGDGLAPGYVFVALQVMDDAVMRLADMPMLVMLREVSEACRARGVRVVVKRHPRCRSEIVTRALKKGVEQGEFVEAHGSIHTLIDGAIAVCVVNSAVGAEALLHHKPVYAFGASEYQQACFRVRRRGQFAALFEPHQLPVSTDVMDKFLYLLRTSYSVDVCDEEQAEAWIKQRVLGFLGAPERNAFSRAAPVRA